MNKKKSIYSILAGFFTGAILSIATDILFESTGLFTPPDQGFFVPWMLWTALFYRTVYITTGSYVTARLAPAHPIRHSMILGAIGLSLTILGSIVMWEKAAPWYTISLILVTLPFTWIGGWIRERQLLPATTTRS